jgi:Tfp pilus assembly PilM family ATPase
VTSQTPPHKILVWKEVSTGPFEDTDEGKPVKDIYDVLTKVLAQEREILQQFGSFSVAISALGVFFRTIEVPKMESSDMQKAVLAEIKKTLPVDFSQVLFAQNDLGEKHENMKTFFCILVQKTTFEKFKEVFAKFSLNPYFEIETFSLARIPARDDLYKLIVHVGKNSTFLIFTHGQIIQSVENLEMGDNKVTDAIEKALKIPFKDVLFLRSGHTTLSEEGRLGGQILDEYVKDFNKTLSKSIALHILEFEKRFKVEIKELIISGSDASAKLKKNIHEEFDAELSVDFVGEKHLDQFVAENFLENDVKKYSINFGLSRRVKQ